MERPPVLILEPDAEDYLSLLDGLSCQGTRLFAVTGADAARAAWSGQPVVLGQPDLVAEALDAMPGVRWVQSTWAGVERLLCHERRDYRLTGVRDVFGTLMAEHVFAYVLAHETQLLERHRRQRRREWWPRPSGTLAGKTLGIMGTGSIGRSIACVGRAFGMRVAGYSRGGAAREGFERVYPGHQLHSFLATADYLVGVLPATPATDGLLDAAALAALPPHCCLINVGRGNLIDEVALAAALSEGSLGGAVLDVFHQEPLPADSPLWEAPNLTVTAHIAAHSRPPDIARIFEENYNRYLTGAPLRHRIDFERGY